MTCFRHHALTAALTLAAMAVSPKSGAVSAYPGAIPYTTPSGQTVEILKHGDEWHHYATTTDGYLVVETPSGALHYATVEAGRLADTSVEVSAIESRTAAEKSLLATIDRHAVMTALRDEAREARKAAEPFMLKFGRTLPDATNGIQRIGTNEKTTTFPTSGSPKVLVVLVEYADVKFSEGNAELFKRHLSERGFNYNGATGSALDYFSDSSNGQYTPQFDVYGPVTLDNNRAYYGGNNSAGNDMRARDMIREACQKLIDAGTVNFADYDTNGDGMVDNVYVYYAGAGEADTNVKEAIWPHASAISPLLADGVYIYRYATSCELSEGARFTGIGTFCHEFSHVMGLPDLYDTDYSGAHDPGTWDIMSGGSYNNSQHTPPIYSVYERLCMGWVNPQELSEPENVTLLPSTDKAGYDHVRIKTTPATNEYFLFENRQQQGWDRYIPGHGMLVWHIDYNANIWNQNTPNSDPAYQRIDIVEADNVQSTSTYSADPFPGTKKITSFTDLTVPAFKPKSGKALETPLTEIGEDNGKIHFLVKGGVIAESSSMQLLQPTDVTPVSARLNWTEVPGMGPYTVVVTAPDGKEMTVRTTPDTSLLTEGLEPSTTYSYTVKYLSGYFYSGKTGSFTTADLTLEYARPTTMPATEIGDVSFTANWAPMSDAETYSVSLYTLTEIESGTHTATFDVADTLVPEDWTTDVTSTISTSGYYGASAPAALFDQDAQSIVSPRFTGTISQIKWVMRRYGTGASELRLQTRASDSDTWTTVWTGAPGANKSRKTFTTNNFGTNCNQARILFIEDGSRIAIDDIEISVSGEIKVAPVAGMTDIDAGAATSYTFTGLNPLTAYAYAVKAHGGGKTSLQSYVERVNTTASSGIDEISGDNTDVTVSASAGTLTVSSASGTIVAEVFTPSGVMVARVEASPVATVALAPGLYVVRAGRTAVKVSM